jgi:hypothetical protein
VDVFGRSISAHENETAIESVCRYLRERRTQSAQWLSTRPAIIVWPEREVGKVIWRPSHAVS